MGFSSKDYRPTYEIVYDLPGQSLGLEAAEKLGFQAAIIGRAREILGNQGSDLGLLLSELLEKRASIETLRREIDEEKRKIELERVHWDSQKEGLAKFRDQIRADLVREYESKFGKALTELRESTEEVKAAQKEISAEKNQRLTPS